MPYTRIKICGITRPEDARLAADLGADAIGLNFLAGPRRIPLDTARVIVDYLPPLVTPVALTSGPTREFPDAPTFEEIRAGTISGGTPGGETSSISTFQFYGTNLHVAARSEDFDVWSVCHVHGMDTPTITAGFFQHLQLLNFTPRAIVLDAAAPGQLGGTGKTVNWHAVVEALNALRDREAFTHIVLAGGLNPSNVAEAVRIVQPFAVDVSSGVEVQGKPGIKDPAKMRDFIEAARSA